MKQPKFEIIKLQICMDDCPYFYMDDIGFKYCSRKIGSAVEHDAWTNEQEYELINLERKEVGIGSVMFKTIANCRYEEW